MLASSMFLISFGTGLLNSVSTNFYKETLQLSGEQVLWLTGIREIPGLILMFIAALIMHLPLSRRAALSVLLMGIGYALHTLVQSYTGLIAVAVVASLGFHNWMPISSSLALALTTKQNSGRVMGSLAAVGALASIAAMVITTGITLVLGRNTPLRPFNAVGGLLMIVAAVLLSRLPKNIGETTKAVPRLLFRRRYWLYYVLTLFEGSRMQVFGAFGTLVLVQEYHWGVYQISALLLTSAVVTFSLARRLGRYLDIVGERVVLSVSYVLLAGCFVGYAITLNPYLLGFFLVLINLLTTLSIGLSTYVNRIAPREELTPILSSGVSVNHITSVGMSLLAGTLLKIVGYQTLCWGAATIIMLSVPFALAIRVPKLYAEPGMAAE
jgi:predicted MFS family arabinose efflux permease